MTFDPTTASFEFRYRSNPKITAPTVIVVPVSTHYPHGYCARASGARITSRPGATRDRPRERHDGRRCDRVGHRRPVLTTPGDERFRARPDGRAGAAGAAALSAGRTVQGVDHASPHLVRLTLDGPSPSSIWPLGSRRPACGSSSPDPERRSWSYRAGAAMSSSFRTRDDP